MHTHTCTQSVPLILQDKVDLDSLSLLLSGRSSSLFLRMEERLEWSLYISSKLIIIERSLFSRVAVAPKWGKMASCREGRQLDTTRWLGKIGTGSVSVCHRPITSAVSFCWETGTSSWVCETVRHLCENSCMLTKNLSLKFGNEVFGDAAGMRCQIETKIWSTPALYKWSSSCKSWRLLSDQGQNRVS